MSVPAAKVVEDSLTEIPGGIDLGKYYPNMKDYLRCSYTERERKKKSTALQSNWRIK